MTNPNIIEKAEVLSQLGFSPEFLKSIEDYNPSYVNAEGIDSVDLLMNSADLTAPDLTLFSPADDSSTGFVLSVR